MNTNLTPLRVIIGILLLLSIPVSAEMVTASYESAATVPVTAASYTAAGNTVAITLGFAPPTGTNLTVVNHTGAGFISGRFSNLAHGQEVALVYNKVTYRFVANYYGGTGNDLVLQWAMTKLYAWGRNTDGQLGTGNTVNGLVPTAVMAGGILAGQSVTATAVGATHSLALCADGTLAAWGSNISGQLGDGTTTGSSQPVAVNLGGVLAGKTIIAIAAGAEHSLALCADGTLAAWGANNFGQLGDGTVHPKTTPVAVIATGALAGKTVTAISAGSRHNLALCADGTVVAWGANFSGQLGNGTTTSSVAPLAVLTNGFLAGKSVTAISAGADFSLALCANGTIAAWGSGAYGCLGDGTSVSKSVPVAVSTTGVLAGKTVAAVVAGNIHTLARCADGTLVAWGGNSYGQLGAGSHSSVPVAITSSGVLFGRMVRDLAAGTIHSLALCADGTLGTWGGNSYGQLGNGTTSTSSVPGAATTSMLGSGEKLTGLAKGIAHHALALAAVPVSSNSTLANLTVNPGSLTTPFAAATTTYDARLPHGTAAVSVTALAADSNASLTVNGIAVASGAASPAIPLLPGNTILTIKVTAQDGEASTSYVVTVRDDATLASLAVSGGALTPDFAAAITGYECYLPTATAAVTVTPTATDATAAITVNGTPVISGAASGPLALAMGTNAISVRVTALDGTATTYQLTVIRQRPVSYDYDSAAAVPITAANYTAAGNTATFTLNFAPPAGTALMVVNNTGTDPIRGQFDNLAQGQVVNLGYGGLTYPFVVNYFGGTGNDLVLEWANTRVVAWGHNTDGQLGNNSKTNSGIAVPVDWSGVLAGQTVTAVATGGTHSLALCADGTLAAWGNDSYRRLGTITDYNDSPVWVDRSGALAGKTVVAIAAGYAHSLALCADGILAAWGYNSSGQLGNGTTHATEGSLPVPVDRTGVLAGKTVVAIAAGSSHCLALCADGTLAAWGGNGSGQLGNNDIADSNVPVPVARQGVLAGKSIIAIAAGSEHSLALCADGTLAAWGANSSGQLGNNTQVSSVVPVLVETSGALAGKTVTAIAAGGGHNLVLCADGTLGAWGSNTSGTLGIGSTTLHSSVPVLVNRAGVLAGKTVAEVRAGSDHSLALCSDGSLAAWGSNYYRQVGNNSTTSANTPVSVVTSILGSGERVTRSASGCRSSHNLAIVAMPPAPLATTLAATAITDTGATLNATANAQGTTTAVSFEYGPTSSYGTAVAAVPQSAAGTTTVSPTATLGALRAGATYHFRVVASSAFGTARGDDMTFTTSTAATLSGLALSDGVLLPALSDNNLRYSAAVPYATDSLTVTAVCPTAGAVITINGAVTESGTASVPLPLAVGNNVFNLVVTAPGGINTRSYVLTVTRLPLTFTYDSGADVPVTVGDFVATGRSAAFALNHVPVPGVSLSVVKNTGLNPIQGTFENLAQWQLVQLTYGGVSYAYVANYCGGTGNDLVLQWANTRLAAWGINDNGQLGNGNRTNGLVPGPVDMSGALGGRTVVAVAVGYSHSLALRADGTLAAWGYNGDGQLGNGTTTTAKMPVLVNRTGVLAGRRVVAITAGSSHNLVLCADGTLAAWGYNGHGQLGNGSKTGSSVPVLVNQSGVLAGKRVSAIACCGGASLALCLDGTLAAWGYNLNGELGNPAGGSTSSDPVLVDTTGVLAGKTVTAIAGGSGFFLALCADGTLAAWGYNGHGELGNNSATSSGVPVAVSLAGALASKTVVAITCGTYHSLAQCSDGTLFAWGNNSSGQLGNNSTTNSSVPVPVTQTGVLAGRTVVAITSGGYHNFALCADGALAAWGKNDYGQLGTNSTSNSHTPVWVNATGLASAERFMAAQGGNSYSLALVATPPPPAVVTQTAGTILDSGATLQGSVNAVGYPTTVTFEYGLTDAYGTTVAATPAAVTGTATTAASAIIGGLRPGTTYHYRIAAASPAGGMATGADLTLTTTTVSTLASLGLSDGVLTPPFSVENTGYSITVPATVASLALTPVVATPGATVTVNGTPVASGSASVPVSLAVGNTLIPCVVTPPDGINTLTYTFTVTRLPSTFTFGSATDVAVTTNGLVATGNPAVFTLNYAPVPGTSLTVVNNTGGNPLEGRFDNLSHGQTVNLTYGGVPYAFVANYFGGTGNDLVLQWANTRLLAWGDNTYGQLGTGNPATTGSTVPLPVEMGGTLAGKTLMATATGGWHNLALCADGSVVAWGNNSNGSLGNNSTANAPVPVAVDQTGALAGKRIVAVAASSYHSLVLCADGSLAAWGYNSNGQLGDGSTTDRPVPVPVNPAGALTGKAVVAIAAGTYHNLALCADGTLAAWGGNGYGQLGNRSSQGGGTPVRVIQNGALAGKSITAIAAGTNHSLALCSDGTVAAWGNNANGQLGNGTTADSSSPVQVNQTGVLAGRTVVAIAAGDHSLALCADGSIAAWGANASGQLGNSSTTSSSVPVLVTRTGVLAGKTVVAIAAGFTHSFALCADGFLAAWGYGYNGQLGTGTTANSTAPVAVKTTALRAGERIAAVGGGGSHSLAVVAAPPGPAVQTLAATAVLDTSATLNGSVNAMGTPTAATFEYGLTNSYGTAVAATPASVTGTTATAASVALNGLRSGTTYHYRITATSGGRMARGDDLTFTTSAFAGLSNLALDGGTLSPAFDTAIASYLATVPNATASITVTPVAASVDATLKVNGTAVASGTPGAPLDLTVGENVVLINVSAADGINTQTYSVKVTRQPAAFVFNAAADVPLTVSDLAADGDLPAITLGFAPPPGTRLLAVNNTGSSPIRGAFANLAQNQRVNLTYGGISYMFVADYFGGTGNDLVLHWANTRLLAWGTGGTLGSGTWASSSVPVPVDRSGVLAGKTVVATATGAGHVLVTCADGTVAAWGANSAGQLGDNSTTSRNIPTRVDQSGVLAGQRVIAVAAGGQHSLALCADGTLAAWGSNAYGQLGDNRLANSSVPVAVDRTGALAGKIIAAIAAGDNHSLVLCTDGMLAAWGYNNAGQLGDNSTTTSIVPVAVLQTGALAGETVTAISAGGNNSLALCADGSLAAWGMNGTGQLGRGAGSNSSVPLPVTQTGVLAGKTVTAIAVGSRHSLALCADGTVAAWGYNYYGALGINSTLHSYVPALVIQSGVLAGKPVAAIAAGNTASLALCADGTLAAWGGGTNGQLGNGGTTQSNVPVLVSRAALETAERFTAAGAGGAFGVATAAAPPAPLLETLAATGITDTTATLNGSANANGTDATVAFEYGLTPSYGATIAATPATVTGTSATAAGATLSGLAAGTTYHFRVVATRTSGTVVGNDLTFTTTTSATLANLVPSSGTLTPAFDGNVTSYLLSVPFATTAVTVTPVAVSPDAAITVNGTAVTSGGPSEPLALAIGDNAATMVVTAADGLSHRTYQMKIVRLPGEFVFNSAADVPLAVGELVATGNPVSVALNFAPWPGTSLRMVDNTGANPIRGAFDGLRQGQRVNLDYGGNTYAFVANYFGGTGNDLILQWANTRLLAWGSNSGGKLGNNSTTASTSPVAVDMSGVLAGRTVTSVSGGSNHVLALCADGTVAAWGANDSGQLGNGTSTPSGVPMWVDATGALAGKAVVAIAAGYSHSLALCSDGTLFAWGGNSGGQLGNNSTVNSNLPVPVDSSGVLAGRTVTAIAAGSSHSLALCSDGTLAAWGANSYGQLGINSKIDSPVPALVNRAGVLAGKRVTSIAAGRNHSLALCADGSLAAWGNNASGQLGDNTLTSRTEAVRVDLAAFVPPQTVVSIAAGSSADHSLALCGDGSVLAWGYNNSGQLGNLSSSNNLRPGNIIQTGLLAGKTITGLAGGNSHSFAVCADGSLAAWGDNSSGQLGIGNTLNSSVPVLTSRATLAPGERFLAGAGGYGFGVALSALPPPSATVLPATDLTATTATLNGTVNPNGATTTVSFEYGPTDSYGGTVVASPSSVTGTNDAAVNAGLSGLAAGITWHYRVVATGFGGIARSADMTFTVNRPPAFAGYAISTPYQTTVAIALRKLLAKAADPDGDSLALTAAGPGTSQGGTAALQADVIRYTPPDNFSGADLFTVIITDARGASVTGTVTVTVGPPPGGGGAGSLTSNPPRLTPLPGGQMAVRFQGIPGRIYRIERSLDLTAWSEVATVTATSAGAVSWTDADPPQPSAFYRLAVP